MKLYTALLLAFAAAPQLKAAAIFDVSANTTVMVRTGDTLTFEIFDGGFRSSAAAFGLPQDPTSISFALITRPVAGAGSFSAALGSVDGSVSLAAGVPLTWESGWISGGAYTGEVSTLHTGWRLSSLLSQQLFASGSMLLGLRNDGPDVTLGLDPYTLRQDLLVSLSGGPLSVGGAVGAVQLESAVRMLNLQSLRGAANQESLALAPEAGSSVLFLCGGLLLCGLSTGLNRLSKPRQ